MAVTTVAQVSPVTSSPLAYLGTFLLAAVVYSLTVHIAARYVLGDVPIHRALLVGPVVAVVVLVLGNYGALAVFLAIAVDFIAIRYVYQLTSRMAAFVTFIHIIVSILVLVVVLSAYRLVVSGLIA